MVASIDEGHMRRALELAERGWGRVSPNPLVGAVVVRDGQIVGEGWYEGPKGRPHAEVRALAEAGDDARGATVVCTLEPCDHVGSTGPCTRALIEAGVSRVVVGAGDPNPLVDGRGLARLRASGIDVVAGVLEQAARDLNLAFERHVTTGRPFVAVKMASSLDGKTASADGSSRWITGGPARADVHRLRAWADAIVVGAGTALTDDPMLTVRGSYAASARPPRRVVLDSTGRIPASLRLFDDAAPTIVATTERVDDAKVRRWCDAGAEVLVIDRDGAGAVSLPALVAELGRRDVQGLVIEGGPSVAWSAVRDDVVDRLILYVAPVLVGGADAPPIIGGAGFRPLDAARRLDTVQVERIGADLKVVADVHGHR